MDIRRDGQIDIWVYDLARKQMTRITSGSDNEEFPVWTPDGTRIVYRSFRSSNDPSGQTLSWIRADGVGGAEVLVHSKAALTPGSWHPYKKLLAYVAATTPGTDDDVMMLPIEGDEISCQSRGMKSKVGRQDGRFRS